MNTILLCFANSRNHPLPSLSREDDEIYQSLLSHGKKEELLLLRDSFITTKKLADYLIEQREDLWLLHYGGHAGAHRLELEDKQAHAGGIAQLIAYCPKLSLVMLNGCATQGQVNGLLDAGVAAIIATSAPVGDLRAMRFSSAFYKALGSGATIKEAFDLGKGAVALENLDTPWERSFVRDRSKSNENESAWGLFVQKGKEEVLKERLPGIEEKAAKIYLSHAWVKKEGETDKSLEEIVLRIYDSLKEDKLQVFRDDMDLEYGGLISGFMKALGAGDLILVFISDAYIRSPYCMFELYEVARNCKWDKHIFSKKVLPIRIESLKLDDPFVLDGYFDYWEKEEAKWANLIQKRLERIGKAQMDRYDKIREIQHQFGNLADWLADINASSVEFLSQDDFSLVRKTIETRLSNNK